MTARKWTFEEDAILRSNPGPLKLLAGLLPSRTWEAIKGRRAKLKLIKLRGIRAKLWAPEELVAIRRLYPDYEAIRRALPHRTQNALIARVGMLGLAREAGVWLGTETKVIRDDDGRSTAKELQAKLGRHSVGAIAVQRCLLGVVFRKRSLPPHLALQADVAKRLVVVGMSKRELSRRISRVPTKFTKFTHKQWADAVKLLGGELYAEWED